uniref:Conotoxin superfamily conkunitzin 7 n=1 Tax=Conus magus TaxID=6492 RepID=A0A679PME5_CONMA|nr:TPA_inf: conotoxin superfamily conkunitzin 7 [Conus magus]
MEGRRFAAVLILTLCMLASGAVAARPKGRLSECNLRKDSGSCTRSEQSTKSEQRYYFSTYYNECRMFTYRGCGGNRNNFIHMYDCRRKCVYTAG